jgi:hypothetical protein
VEGAQPRGVDGVAESGLAAHHDDRDLGPAGTHLSQDLQAVAAGERQVEEHDVRLVRRHAIEAGFPARGLVGLVALRRQHAGDHAPDVALVIDDQHA